MVNENNSRIDSEDGKSINNDNSYYKNVLLIGSPNVGKSLTFNKLTGMTAMVSNYPGTTVDIDEGNFTYENKTVHITDPPGLYDLNTITEEERVAKLLVLDEQFDLMVHVVDAKNIEKSIDLTLQLIDAGKDVIVKDQNVEIDASNLYYDRYKTEKVVMADLDADTLYQIRLSALDNTTDIEHNQDYYLDNNKDYFFPTSYQPKNFAYIDGKTKTIMTKEAYSTKIYIDPEIDETKPILEQLNALQGMDLNETGEYKIDDLRPKQLFIGPGIMMTIGYCVSFVTYNFEENERYLSKTKKDNYDNAVAVYNAAVKDFAGDYSRIETAIQNVESSYNALLLQIEKDLAQYKEENGLGEDE